MNKNIIYNSDEMNFSPNSQDEVSSRFFSYESKNILLEFYCMFVMESHSNKQPNQRALMLFSRANRPHFSVIYFAEFALVFLSDRLTGTVTLKFQGKILASH